MSKSTIIDQADAVWCIQSGTPGPHVGFVGGTHGNEAAGIAIVTHLRDAFFAGDLTLERGRLTLALGNIEAIALNARGTAPGRDLNRCFTTRELKAPSDNTPESLRAHVLANALHAVEIGIDLHATNLPSTPFLVVQALRNARAHEVVDFLGAHILLTDPNWIFGGEASTLDEFFNRESERVGVCYETGFASDVGCVTSVEHELLDLLRHFGLIEGAPRARIPRLKERYELVSAIILRHDGFTFVEEDTLANFRALAPGELIGHDSETPVIAEGAGVLVFPKASHLRFPGKPVGYIARRI